MLLYVNVQICWGGGDDDDPLGKRKRNNLDYACRSCLRSRSCKVPL